MEPETDDWKGLIEAFPECTVTLKYNDEHKSFALRVVRDDDIEVAVLVEDPSVFARAEILSEYARAMGFAFEYYDRKRPHVP